MKTGWKIAVVILLVAGVVIAMVTKNKKPSERAVYQSGPKASSSIPTVTKPELVKITPKSSVRPGDICPPSTAKQKPKSTPAIPKKLPKLLDLGASKCIPCKMMVTVLDELTKEYKGKLEVEFIDVWQDQTIAEKYGIQSIPTQIFFDAKGKEFYRHVGYFPKEDILKVFKDNGINF